MGYSWEEIKRDRKSYDDEPVLYCEHCLSLRVKSLDIYGNMLYCDSCSGTNILECDIEKLLDMRKDKYNLKAKDIK